MAAGTVPSLLSLTVELLCVYERVVNKRHCSSVFIPFIGPLLWDAGLSLLGTPWWWLVVPWIVDIGTIALLFALPFLVREWWETCLWTRTHILKGTHENYSATLTLHRTGKYLLRKQWQHPLANSENAVRDLHISFSEPGEFVWEAHTLELHAHYGVQRILHPQDPDWYKVEDSEAMPDRHSLQGWYLRLEG